VPPDIASRIEGDVPIGCESCPLPAVKRNTVDVFQDGFADGKAPGDTTKGPHRTVGIPNEANHGRSHLRIGKSTGKQEGEKESAHYGQGLPIEMVGVPTCTVGRVETAGDPENDAADDLDKPMTRPPAAAPPTTNPTVSHFRL